MRAFTGSAASECRFHAKQKSRFASKKGVSTSDPLTPRTGDRGCEAERQLREKEQRLDLPTLFVHAYFVRNPLGAVALIAAA